MVRFTTREKPPDTCTELGSRPVRSTAPLSEPAKPPATAPAGGTRTKTPLMLCRIGLAPPSLRLAPATAITVRTPPAPAGARVTLNEPAISAPPITIFMPAPEMPTLPAAVSMSNRSESAVRFTPVPRLSEVWVSATEPRTPAGLRVSAPERLRAPIGSPNWACTAKLIEVTWLRPTVSCSTDTLPRSSKPPTFTVTLLAPKLRLPGPKVSASAPTISMPGMFSATVPLTLPESPVAATVRLPAPLLSRTKSVAPLPKAAVRLLSWTRIVPPASFSKTRSAVTLWPATVSRSPVPEIRRYGPAGSDSEVATPSTVTLAETATSAVLTATPRVPERLTPLPAFSSIVPRIVPAKAGLKVDAAPAGASAGGGTSI